MKRGWDTTQRRELLVRYAHSGGPTPGPATSGDRVPTSKVRSSRRSDVGWMPGSQPTGAAILLGPGLRPISHKPPPLVLRIALSLQCLLRVCDHESLKQTQQTLRYLKSGNLILRTENTGMPLPQEGPGSGGEQPTLLGRSNGQAPAGHFLFLVDIAPARTRLSSVHTRGLMLPWPSSEQEVLAVSLPGSVPTGMCYCHQGPCNLAHLLPP